MTILKPTPGELYDRLCVLELKLQHAGDKQLPCSHFEDERDEIAHAIVALPTVDRLTLAGYVVQLALTNAKLWALTDEQARIRIDHVSEQKRAAEVLIELREANAERHRLRHLIDSAFGQYRGPEKV